MRYRLLGSSGLRVSELFLGAMTFAEGFAHGAGVDEARRIVDAYLACGGNVVDTAVNYRDGASEEIVGEVLTGRRDRFVLATKYGVSRDRTDPNAAGSHRKNLRLSLETSLRRLRTDYIDLLYVHLWDHLTPIEETMRALDDAVRAGTVLHVGISDTPAWVAAHANTFARAHGLTPFAALQARYNLLCRDAERDLIPAAESLGMSVAAWSPLGGGVLSGKFTRPGGADAPTRVSRDSISERDHAVAGVARDVADELGASASQVSLPWTMARSPAVHPILGVRRLDQLHDNLGAAGLTLPPKRWTGSTPPARSTSAFRTTSSATCRTSCSATPTCDRMLTIGRRPAERRRPLRGRCPLRSQYDEERCAQYGEVLLAQLCSPAGQGPRCRAGCRPGARRPRSLRRGMRPRPSRGFAIRST